MLVLPTGETNSQDGSMVTWWLGTAGPLWEKKPLFSVLVTKQLKKKYK